MSQQFKTKRANVHTNPGGFKRLLCVLHKAKAGPKARLGLGFVITLKEELNSLCNATWITKILGPRSGIKACLSCGYVAFTFWASSIPGCLYRHPSQAYPQAD